MIFHKNRLPADNSYEISYLIFGGKLRKMSKNLSSAADVIGALRVRHNHNFIINIFIYPYIRSIIIPPANFVCRGYTVFHVVRTCVRACVRPSVRL